MRGCSGEGKLLGIEGFLEISMVHGGTETFSGVRRHDFAIQLLFSLPSHHFIVAILLNVGMLVIERSKSPNSSMKI